MDDLSSGKQCERITTVLIPALCIIIVGTLLLYPVVVILKTGQDNFLFQWFFAIIIAILGARDIVIGKQRSIPRLISATPIILTASSILSIALVFFKGVWVVHAEVLLGLTLLALLMSAILVTQCGGYMRVDKPERILFLNIGNWKDTSVSTDPRYFSVFCLLVTAFCGSVVFAMSAYFQEDADEFITSSAPYATVFFASTFALISVVKLAEKLYRLQDGSVIIPSGFGKMWIARTCIILLIIGGISLLIPKNLVSDPIRNSILSYLDRQANKNTDWNSNPDNIPPNGYTRLPDMNIPANNNYGVLNIPNRSDNLKDKITRQRDYGNPTNKPNIQNKDNHKTNKLKNASTKTKVGHASKSKKNGNSYPNTTARKDKRKTTDKSGLSTKYRKSGTGGKIKEKNTIQKVQSKRKTIQTTTRR